MAENVRDQRIRILVHFAGVARLVALRSRKSELSYCVEPLLSRVMILSFTIIFTLFFRDFRWFLNFDRIIVILVTI